VAFSWHPLHPGVYQRGVFGDKFIAHTDQDRRREQGSVAGAGSAGTGRVDGRSRLTSLELVIGHRKHWLNWFGFANQLGNPSPTNWSSHKLLQVAPPKSIVLDGTLSSEVISVGHDSNVWCEDDR